MKYFQPGFLFLLLLSAAASAQNVCFNTTGINTTLGDAATILDSNRDGKNDVLFPYNEGGSSTGVYVLLNCS